jgi:RNA polymerase sigma-70 factor (ECF subfamily)
VNLPAKNQIGLAVHLESISPVFFNQPGAVSAGRLAHSYEGKKRQRSHFTESVGKTCLRGMHSITMGNVIVYIAVRKSLFFAAESESTLEIDLQTIAGSNLLPFVRMSALSWVRYGSLRDATHARYAESRAQDYAIDADTFETHVMRVVERYAPRSPVSEQVALVRSLHIEELALARACSAGSDVAWDAFLARYRADMHRAACQITRNDAAGRDLADGLYAELFGLPNRDGRRVSKLDYYMGRGSLSGWLRTVMAQKHIDRCRTGVLTVSLEEQVEQGASFISPFSAANSPDPEPVDAAFTAVLADCQPDERFLLATYFLDGCTLAQIGRQLGVHESTVSRKLDRLTSHIRKRVRKRLLQRGLSPPRCDELLAELDVRDLNVDVAATLRQEKEFGSF